MKTKKESSKVAIKTQEQVKRALYRVYSDAGIDKFLKEDKLSRDFAKKVQNNISSFTIRNKE